MILSLYRSLHVWLESLSSGVSLFIDGKRQFELLV